MNLESKIIWTCWFQGLNNLGADTINAKCISKWIELNNDYRVIVLTNENICDYVPTFFKILSNSPQKLPVAPDPISKRSANRIKLARESDLLRLLILEKFGGLWVDSSVYPMVPFDFFRKNIIKEKSFFAYRFLPRLVDDKFGSREISSWMLYSKYKNFHLAEKWKNLLCHDFLTLNYWPYFNMHQKICDLYDSDLSIKSEIETMPQLNYLTPHSAGNNWNERRESFFYKDPNLLLN